jgi:hypothetical protein
MVVQSHTTNQSAYIQIAVFKTISFLPYYMIIITESACAVAAMGERDNKVMMLYRHMRPIHRECPISRVWPPNNGRDGSSFTSPGWGSWRGGKGSAST